MIGLLGSLLGSQGGRMLGGMIGGRTGAMIGGMAGAMLGGRRLGGLLGAAGGMKDRLAGDDDGHGGEQLNDDEAALLVRIMANAAKSDGEVSQTEADAIVGQLGDVTDQERDFIRQELGSPFTDAGSLARSVPDDLRAEAYMVSLAAIDVDTDEESAYLAALAGELGLDRSVVDAIHEDFQVPKLR